jgi:type I restriction enzyme, S subunit
METKMSGIKHGWKKCQWGDLTTLEYGKGLRDYGDQGPYPVYGTNGQIGWYEKPLCNTPGIIIGRKGAYRGVHYSDRPFFVIDTAFYLRPLTDNFDLRWAYYQLLNFDINSLDSGSAIPSTSREAFYQIPVDFPPLSTQRRIASILSAYDDLIENNTRRIKILEQMVQMIYREWFVEFRAPGVKLRKATPEEQKVTGKDRFPVGWEMKQLGDVIELAYGKALKADTRVPGQVPVYGSAGVTGYHNESLVAGPGIIVGRKGNVGSVFWSDKDFFPIDTAFYVVTELNLHYVYYNLREQNFINSDAAVPGLSRNQAYLNPFIVPASKALSAFGEFISPVFKQVQNLTAKNANLRQTRDLLLPRLVGERLL